MIFFLAELPNGIAPPIHMFDWRYNQDIRNWILLPILLITLYWFYRYFKNLQKDIIKRKPPKPIVSSEVLKEKIETVERNYSSNFKYREGLHELSLILKSHFESKTGIEIEEMTAEEISKRIKDKKVIGFFNNLSSLQFGKKNPLKSEFDEMFIEAKVVTGVMQDLNSKTKEKKNTIVRPVR
ncbi:MAG: hypothetical protein IPL26_23545 [Leptospiraceae bacterium]|nr:hypothetical protein [Leptospiraceae bacterium]